MTLDDFAKQFNHALICYENGEPHYIDKCIHNFPGREGTIDTNHPDYTEAVVGQNIGFFKFTIKKELKL